MQPGQKFKFSDREGVFTFLRAYIHGGVSCVDYSPPDKPHRIFTRYGIVLTELQSAFE